MPGKVKVKIIAGRNLPVMDRGSETTDAYVEIKLGTITHKTDVCRKSLNPQWNSDWYRFEVDDAELQDEPLQIRLMDYDTYSANDAIGKVYINLNPLLLPHKELIGHTSHSSKGSVMSGWIPVYDTMHGIRGEVNLIVKVDLFSDLNKFRQSSCGVQFFHSHNIPHGYHAQLIHGFVEELLVNDDPEYQWIDKIRTPRASNEARLVAFLKLSGQVQRKIGLKAIDLGANAVIGYNQCFDLEGDVGVVARGIGTAVTLVKIHEAIPLPIVDTALVEERTLKYLEFLTSSTNGTLAKGAKYNTGHNTVYTILGLSPHQNEVVATTTSLSTTPTQRLNRMLNRSPVRNDTAIDQDKLSMLLQMEDSRSVKPEKKKFKLKLNKLKAKLKSTAIGGGRTHQVTHKAKSVDFSTKGNIHLDKGLPRSVSDNQHIQHRSSIDLSRRSLADIKNLFGKGKRQKFQRSTSDGANMTNLLVRSMIAAPLDSIHEHDSAGSSVQSTKGADAMHAAIKRRPSVKSLLEEPLAAELKPLKTYGSAVSSDFSISEVGVESSSSSDAEDDDDDDIDEDMSEACSFVVTPDNGIIDPETVSMVVRNVLADERATTDYFEPGRMLSVGNEPETLSAILRRVCDEEEVIDYFEPSGLLKVNTRPVKSVSCESLDIHTGSTHVIRSNKGFVSQSEMIDHDANENHTLEGILSTTTTDKDADNWIQPGSTREESVGADSSHKSEGLLHGLKEKIHHLQDHMHFHHSHTAANKEHDVAATDDEPPKERRNSLLHDVKEKIHHLQDHMHFHHSQTPGKDVKDETKVDAGEEPTKERRNSLLHDMKETFHNIQEHIHMPHLHISEKLHNLHLLPHSSQHNIKHHHNPGLLETAMETMLMDKLNIMEAQTGLTPTEEVEKEPLPSPSFFSRRRSSLDSLQPTASKRITFKRGSSLDESLHLRRNEHSNYSISISENIEVAKEAREEGGAASADKSVSDWTSELKLSYENLRKPLLRQNAMTTHTNLDITDTIFRADLNTARIAIFVENKNDQLKRAASLNDLNTYANHQCLSSSSTSATPNLFHFASSTLSPSPPLPLSSISANQCCFSAATATATFQHQNLAATSFTSTSSCDNFSRSCSASTTTAHRQRRRKRTKSSNDGYSFAAAAGDTNNTHELFTHLNLTTNNYRSLHASSLSPPNRTEFVAVAAASSVIATSTTTTANTSISSLPANVTGNVTATGVAVTASKVMPMSPRSETPGIKAAQSPARLSGTPGTAVIPIGTKESNSSYGLCRRSSDSDLSITPKGNSLNERTSAFVRVQTGTLLKPPLTQENLDMLEYPFITMGKYPNGFILHLGATVAARSVKLLERVPNPDEPETRDSWWNEIRMEIRSHARALGCNVVLGYSELTSITEDVCVLSATGTAAVVNLQYGADLSGGVGHLDVSGGSSKSSAGGKTDTMTTSLDRQEFDFGTKLPKEKEMLSTIDSDTELGACTTNKENNTNSMNGLHTQPVLSPANVKPCSICHIPYMQNSVPFRISMLKCAICKRGKVPDVLLATIEMPESLQVTGRGCLLQAHVCRPKRDLRSESNAKEISDGLPFLEYELHKLLICKLKVKGMNAIFGLKTTVTVGEKMIALVATATAVFLTALQPPVIPKVVGGNSWTDIEKLMELQRSIHDTVDKNREIYQLKTFQEYDTNNGTTASKQLFPSDTDDSDDEMNELDLTAGNKDACVLEVDDIQDLEVISQLMEGCPPDGFHVVNTQAVPGLHDLEVVKNLQMFTQIWRAKLSLNHGSKNFSRHFQRLLQTIYFKLRTMMPCAICDLRFRLDFPEPEEIQVMVTGVALGLGEPSKLKAKRKAIAHSVSKDAIKRVDDDMIFSLDEDQTTEVAPPQVAGSTLQHSGSLKVRKRSPMRGRLGSGRLTRHLPTQQRERYGVDITPLSHVPGGRIDKYLGNLNFFFIRESTSVRENGGICGFVHSFVTELLAVVRAHVTSLGGNAMIAFYMTELMLVDNPHKNQGQCLISVGGDVVFVSYFNDD